MFLETRVIKLDLKDICFKAIALTDSRLCVGVFEKTAALFAKIFLFPILLQVLGFINTSPGTELKIKLNQDCFVLFFDFLSFLF